MLPLDPEVAVEPVVVVEPVLVVDPAVEAEVEATVALVEEARVPAALTADAASAPPTRRTTKISPTATGRQSPAPNVRV